MGWSPATSSRIGDGFVNDDDLWRTLGGLAEVSSMYAVRTATEQRV